MVTKIWGYLEVLTSTDLNDTFAECATLIGTETLTNKKLQLQNANSTPEANTMVNEAIIKAWCFALANATISASYNVYSVTRTGLGEYTVVLKRPFTEIGALTLGCAWEAGSPAVLTHVTGSFSDTSTIKIKTYNSAGSLSDVSFSFIAIGAQ
jgi:hypothetical protein